ncbi:uncharacterized protein SCDLUD_003632 [Saccharomycodes ludwigii]|uniref:uncharacterized protein n=1 Tax=Saccharomycodes ludwigii TaxID=36035 RepID=UPI001E8B46FC|nr:hypothetical protein SCDLUD_003632 [Saccharomycodes ludwigii]KAH3900637.1 hypothetical protein SCDLUD_003632 [Saccharomycodes ludwigii]
MNQHLTVIAPFKFSGAKKDVSRIPAFLLSFETQFAMCGIKDDYVKICFVGQNLTDNALQWFTNYFNHNDCRAMTYSAFAADFKDYYSSKIDSYQIVEKLKRVSQKEDVDTYVKQFMTYYAMLPRNYMSDDFAIDLFIQGLKIQTRQLMRMHRFDKLIDAVNAAVRTEHCREDLDVSLNFDSNLVGNTNKLDKDLDYIMNAIDNTRRGYSNAGRRYTGRDKGGKNSYRKDNFQEKFYNVCRRNKLCFNCGSPEHARANCPGNARPSY